MFEEVPLFVYGVIAAVVLIAIVAHFYMPTLAGAAQAQAEYAALRDAAPTLILAQDGKSVHICINSTAPQRVLVQRFDMWIDAQKDCRISLSGRCVPEGRATNRTWPFCRWYLGTYKPGDNLTVVLKTDRATVIKSYRVAAISFPTQLYVVPYVQNVTETVTVKATATVTGVVYHTTVVIVPETATVYRTYTELVPATTTRTITYTVIIQDPRYTATHYLLRCWGLSERSPAGQACDTPARYGFQLPTITITSTSTTTKTLTSTATSYTTVTSYTTSYVTSYVTSIVSTTTIWTRVTHTYVPTVTTTTTSALPGVVVYCYVCPTYTTGKVLRCDTTTLATTTRTLTTITGYGAHSSVQPAAHGAPSRDTFVLALSAVALMAGSVTLARRR